MSTFLPSTVPLPSELRQLLDEKAQRQGQLSSDLVENWMNFRELLDVTVEKMRALASHPELWQAAEKAGESIEPLNNAVLNGSALDAVNAAFSHYHLVAKYGWLREKLRVTTLERTDKLIHACKACELNRLDLGVLKNQIPFVVAEIDTLVDFYERGSESFPEPIQQGFLKAIQAIQFAVESLRSLSPESQNRQLALKDAATNLANGAKVLEYIQSWGLELAKEESSAVPMVGDLVKVMRHELAEDRQLSPERLEQWSDDAFWDLQERWAEDRHDFFMPRYHKDRFVASIDELMNRLKDLHEYTPQEQDEMLYLLEIKFEEVARKGFDLDKLSKHAHSWLTDYIVAVLANGVPEFHIQHQIEQLTGTTLNQYGELLRRFLEEDDRDYLLDALSQIEQELEA